MQTSRLARALRIRPGEERMVALLVGLMASTTMGLAIGQSAVDALFFSRSGVRTLPVMYLVLGPLVLAASLGVSALLGRQARERLLPVLPLPLAALLVAERAVLASDPSWIYPVMWLTVGVVQLVQNVGAWGVAGLTTDTRQAKRLFPLFGAGSILGAVAGGFLTRPLADALHSENLLLLWAASLVGAAVLGRTLIGSGRDTVSPRRGSQGRASSVLDEMRLGFRAVAGSPLLRWMAAAGVLFSFLFFSLYLPFSRAAVSRFPDPDDLAGFLGVFSGLATAGALLVSILVANRLFARLGVPLMILALPLIYIAGFGVLVVQASFASLVLFRFIQTVWLQGVASSGWEALVNVVPPGRRDQARTFLSGGPAQLGTVLAGLIQLVGEGALSPELLYVIGLAMAALTAVVAVRIRASYADALVDAIRSGHPQVFSREDEPFPGAIRDADAIAVTAGAAADPDLRVRRVAVEVLGDLGAADGLDALRAGIRDPDSEVRRRSLRSIARIDPGLAAEEARRGLADDAPEVRREAILTLSRLGIHPEEDGGELRSLLRDPDRTVQALTAGSLIRAGPDPEAMATLTSMVRSADPSARAEAVTGLGFASSPEPFDLIVECLGDPAPAVRAAAAAAAARSDPGRATPVLVRLLGDEDGGVRRAAAMALGRLGPAGEEPVVAALSDPDLESGAVLALQYLPVAGHEERLTAYARATAERALQDHDLAVMIAPEGDERVRLLRDSLEYRARRLASNTLRAVAVAWGRPALEVAIESLETGDPDPVQRANALETIESAGDPSVVRPLLRIWEPMGRPGPALSLHARSLLRTHPDPWIRTCAEFAGPPSKGAAMTTTLATLPPLERILFLRKVSLFDDMPPSDLRHVAAVATENAYVDGETIAAQGEMGDEMHIVVAGEVLVLAVDAEERQLEVARRGEGSVVGEMSIITSEPRMASLVASGEVRTLSIGRREFESMLRERPDVALAVMRELCERLRACEQELGVRATG
jgi:HEAT repeat protein